VVASPAPGGSVSSPGDRLVWVCSFDVTRGGCGFDPFLLAAPPPGSRRIGAAYWQLPRRVDSIPTWRCGTPSDAQIQSAVMRGPIARVVPAVLVP